MNKTLAILLPTCSFSCFNPLSCFSVSKMLQKYIDSNSKHFCCFIEIPPWIFFFIIFKDYICFFVERGEVREKEGERNINVRDKHQSTASQTYPNWRPNPQPRYVPWLRIKPANFCLSGGHPTNWANTGPVLPLKSPISLGCLMPLSWFSFYCSGHLMSVVFMDFSSPTCPLVALFSLRLFH